MVYSISYDLKQPNRNYDDLYKGIKSFGQWWHQTESVWIIVSEKSAVDIRDYLQQFIDSNDSLFVIALNKNWAAVGFSQEEYTWLKSISDTSWQR